MSKDFPVEGSQHVYRLTSFRVPASARGKFLERVETTRPLLKKQPGFVHDLLLEQHGIQGEFNFITLVEWRSQDAADQAKKAVAALHRELGFDPQEMRTRLGIAASDAAYRRVRS